MSIVVRRLDYSDADKHGTGPDRYRFSNFLITLNTNVRFEESDADLTEYAQTFGRSVEIVCNNFNRYIMFRKVDHVSEDGRATFADPEPAVDEHGGPIYNQNGKQKMTYPESEDTFYSADTVPKIMVDIKPEKGVNSKGQRLHVHIAARIKHKGYIWIRRDAFLKGVNDSLQAQGFPWPVKHMDIKVHDMNVLDYLEWDET